jgi:hypothetical protein
MNLVRWLLGLSSALALAGWILLVMAADDFRRSFGASSVGALRLAALPLVLLLVTVTVVYPTNRALLHFAAILLGLAMIGAVFILRESLFVGITGIVYICAWLLFYLHAAWSQPRS